MTTRRTLVIAALLATATAVLYGRGLGQSPPYLHYDEIFFALHAHSIATTGHDLNGRFLPLYFYTLPVYWAQPIIIYSMALLLKFAAMSQAVVRWPSVCVGIVDVVLTYTVGRRIFRHGGLAVAAAALLALTPAHFLHSRLAMDYVFPLPFVLAWLWCVLIYLDTDREWPLAAGACILGVGVYSYIASLALMPVYVAITFMTILAKGVRSPRPYLLVAAGFGVCLLPLFAWLLAHPEIYRQYAIRYNLYDATKLGPLQGAKELSSFTSLTERTGVYYDYFNPSYLFFAGGSNIVNTTRMAGVFLFPIAVFLPVGAWQLLRHPNRPLALLLLAGLLTAPLAATIVAEAYAIDRELEVVPFGVLIATVGIEHLLHSARAVVRIAALALLVLVPVQFVSYYRDYMTDYVRRAGIWFGGNLEGAFEQVMAYDRRTPLSGVYLPLQIPNADSQWRYYLLADQRMDLFNRAKFYDLRTVDIASIAGPSIVLSFVGDASEGPFARSQRFRKIASVAERGADPIYVLYECR